MDFIRTRFRFIPVWHFSLDLLEINFKVIFVLKFLFYFKLLHTCPHSAVGRVPPLKEK